MSVLITVVGAALLVGFVGFWVFYAGIATWNEFVEPELDSRRKLKKDREDWNEYDEE